MSLTIKSNTASLRNQRQLNQNTAALGKTFEKLSSGKEINRASDNPAALQIAMDLLANADTGAVAARNISDGVSVANIADGALESASNITTRLNELATQASNGTLSSSQRSALNAEYQALRSELDRVSQTTEFNGQQLLNGSSTVDLQVGSDGSESSRIGLSLPGLAADDLGLPTDISSQANAQAAIDATKDAGQQIAQSRGEIGATVNRLGSAFQNLKTTELNQREAASRIQDVDVAEQSSNLLQQQIRQQASSAIGAQANQQPSLALRLLE